MPGAAGAWWRCPLSCGLAGPGRGGGGPASQQKEKAQLTSTWWRRIAISERTWKPGPAELVLDLLVRLLHPVPQPVDPHDLGQARGRPGAVSLVRAAGPGQVRDQVPGGLARQGARA